MKKYSLLFALVFGLASPSARLLAAESATQAKVISIEGDAAQVQLAGGQLRALQAGESLPQGATVITGANTTVVIAPLDGTATSVQPESRVLLEKMFVTTQGGRVTKQTAILDLKSGRVANVLDASKKAINDFSIRTANGMAHAEGTTFAVEVLGLEGKVTTGNGEVSFTAKDGSKFVVKGGQLVSASAGGQLQVVSAANNPFADLVMAAIANTAAKAAAEPAKYGIDPATAKAELTGTITTLVQAAPGSAATIVASAVKAVPAETVYAYAIGNVVNSEMTGTIAQAALTAVKGLSGKTFTSAVDNISKGVASGLAQNPGVANAGTVALQSGANWAIAAAATHNAQLSDAQKVAVLSEVTKGTAVTQAFNTPVTTVDARIVSPSN